jgi:hypothetical protein
MIFGSDSAASAEPARESPPGSGSELLDVVRISTTPSQPAWSVLLFHCSLRLGHPPAMASRVMLGGVFEPSVAVDRVGRGRPWCSDANIQTQRFGDSDECPRTASVVRLKTQLDVTRGSLAKALALSTQLRRHRTRASRARFDYATSFAGPGFSSAASPSGSMSSFSAREQASNMVRAVRCGDF